MLTRSKTMATPEAAGEIARMERVSDSPRPTTAVETAPNVDHTKVCPATSSIVLNLAVDVREAPSKHRCIV